MNYCVNGTISIGKELEGEVVTSYWFSVSFVDLQMGKHVDAYNILISKMHLKVVILSSRNQSQPSVNQRLRTGKTVEVIYILFLVF